jgi:beta-phosphoglucomutase-like phosphatase (HAD superfamily)
MMIKAVVFDMDGVLIDATDWHFHALNQALSLFGLEIEYEEHLSQFNGLPTKSKLKILSKTKNLPTHLHQVIEQIKQDRTIRIAAQLCFPRVEHLLMMSYLKRKGIKIGVATNSIRTTTITMLTFAGIIEFVDILLTNEDVKNPKPDPEIYKMIADKFEIKQEEILIVEDSDVGYSAAVNSGSQVIRVAGVDEVDLELIINHLGLKI